MRNNQQAEEERGQIGSLGRRRTHQPYHRLFALASQRVMNVKLSTGVQTAGEACVAAHIAS
jgi:hypothetical protein